MKEALCWDPAPPNSTSRQPCPPYIVGMENEGFDGRWGTKPPITSNLDVVSSSPLDVVSSSPLDVVSSSPLDVVSSSPLDVVSSSPFDGVEKMNASQVVNVSAGNIIRDDARPFFMDGGVQENRQVDARRTTGRYDAWLPFLKKTSLIGYSISLITLTISFIILAALTKLRCPRNMLHLHLFASFILRAAVVLLRSSVLSSSMLTPSPTQTTTANLNPVVSITIPGGE
ncbi:hypothetical protein HAZT_HAZT006349 [Hyalella azteca]|uniref:Uncharacterized protein n=1 Tax=Hyalella azteca TaxID=294128 RepID=A0A6A0GR07_HYAAZ|nr:hypothetical protein HAZT_HAZT006349 [Hyalella azteca]